MDLFIKKTGALLCLLIALIVSTESLSQETTLEFGTISNLESLTGSKKAKQTKLKWIDVNTSDTTWSVKDGMLICKGLPIGVMRSEKEYENFIMHVEWRHMEKGGNSGVFVWSSAVPGDNRLPDGVEVQMLELGWIELNTKDGVEPPIAYVHGELFGVGGVKTVPDNPRGERSKSIKNLCKGRGEWNTYDVVCVDGVIKLAVNGTFVNGISKASQKKGYLCLEAEGAEIHMRNFRLIELPQGVKAN